MRRRCESLAMVSAAFQSSGLPSRTASTSSTSSGSSSGSNGVSLATIHFLDEAEQCPLRRLPRRGERRFPRRVGEFFITQSQLHPADHKLAILFAQTIERRLVSLDGLSANRLLQRRRHVVGLLRIER